MEPVATTMRALNEELKNPHLVETLIHVPPSTGKLIETADPRPERMRDILRAKLSGNIPIYDVAFNISGIPLLLTRQSFLQLRLRPVFHSDVRFTNFFHSVPAVFEFNRALWPKKNVSCIESAGAVFSNFAAENQTPTILPYLRALRQNIALAKNYMRTWNPSYLTTVVGVDGVANGVGFVYGNRLLNIPVNGTFEQPRMASPFSAALEPKGNNSFMWYGNDLLLHIPLEEILPVFQIPVIPLKQTNSSSIQLRLRLLSPQHMFFCSRYLNPASACGIISEALEAGNANLAGGDGIYAYQLGEVQTDTGPVELQNAVMGGGTLKWLKAVTNTPFATLNTVEMFDVDFTVECELVLRCLTTPLLNPLTFRYIEPFINESNEFIAHYQDSYVFSQTLDPKGAPEVAFTFTPTQLFYNTTHVALFFMQSPTSKHPGEVDLPTSLSGPVPAGLASSLFKHGHFFLDKGYSVDEVMITLGPGQTGLYDHPLDFAELFSVTEEALKRYDPAEMNSDMLFIQNRFTEGDAVFLFDLSHSRDSGFFIDVDNMIRVSGVVRKRATFGAIDLGAARAPAAPRQPDAAANQAGVARLRMTDGDGARLSPGQRRFGSAVLQGRDRNGALIERALQENVPALKDLINQPVATRVSVAVLDPEDETDGVAQIVFSKDNHGINADVVGQNFREFLTFTALATRIGEPVNLPTPAHSPALTSATPLNVSAVAGPGDAAMTTGGETLGALANVQRDLPQTGERQVALAAENRPREPQRKVANITTRETQLTVTANEAPITVMMALIYQNTFSVLLDADGLVLIQQQ